MHEWTKASRAAVVALAPAAVLAGCPKFTQVEGTPLPRLSRPIVLMHRGGGAGNPVHRENTMPAILFGAGLYDGAEVDLQLSTDGTLWLGHDNQVHDCQAPSGASPTSGAVVGCFQDLSDGAIDAVAYCNTTTALPCTSPTEPSCRQNYVRLEEVVARFSSDPALLPKFIALDVKDQLCHLLSVGIPESRRMADQVHALTVAYGMAWRLFVESDQASFIDRFHEKGTPTYVFVEGYGAVNPIIAEADRLGATGISYRYTAEQPYVASFTDGLRNVGLRTLVWPVPSPPWAVSDVAPVYGMFPDIIKTDLPNFYEYVAAPKPF